MTEPIKVSIDADSTGLKAGLSDAQAQVAAFAEKTAALQSSLKEVGDAAQKSLSKPLAEAGVAASQAGDGVSKLGAALEKSSDGPALVEHLAAGLKKVNEGAGFLEVVSAFKELTGWVGAAAQALEFLAVQIDKTAKTGESLQQLGEATGLSVEQVSSLRVVATEVGGSFDTLSQALPSFAQTMATAAIDPSSKAAAAFGAVGVSLRDAQQQLRPVGSVLEEVSAKLASNTDAGKRAADAAGLFGAKSQELLPILVRLGQEGFRSAKEESDALWQSWRGDDAKAAAEMEEDLRRLGALFSGIGDTILKKFIPAIDGAMGRLLRLVAPDNLDRLKNQVSDLEAHLEDLEHRGTGRGLKPSPEQSAELQRQIDQTRTLIELRKIDIEEVEAGRVAPGSQFAKQLAAAKSDAPEAPLTAPTGPDPSVQRLIDEIANSQKISQLETGLATQSVAINQHETDGKIQQNERWWREYSDGMRQQIDAARGNAAEQAALVGEWVKVGEALYGGDVAKYKAALDEKSRLAREAVNLQRELASTWQGEQSKLAQMSLQDQIGSLDEQVATGQVAADQKYKMEQQLYDKIYQLRRQDSLDQLATAQVGTKAALESYDRILELDQQHQTQLTNVDRQQAQARANNEKQVNEEIARTASSSIMSMLEGKENFTQVAEHLADQLLEKELTNVIESGLQAVEHALATETSKTAISAAGSAARTGIGETESGGLLSDIATMLLRWLGLETTKTGVTAAQSAARTAAADTADLATATASAVTASGEIDAAAAVAAANAFAATAAIPIVGPVLAPAAAAAAFGEVEAFQAFAFAEKGWGDVPNDNMPTLLHAHEMVLPARYADVIRGMAGGGSNGQSYGLPGGSVTSAQHWGLAGTPDPAEAARAMVSASPAAASGAAGGNGAPQHFHYSPSVQAMDETGVDRVLRNHGGRFAQYAANARRNAVK